MTKAIIFDTDGMVVNSESFSVKYSREHGIPYEEILPFFKNEFQRCLIGEADVKEQLEPYLVKWGWNKSADEFLQSWFTAEHKIDQRILEIIRKLRRYGIKCYLATNQEKYRNKYLRIEMGFDQVFDEIFSSAELGFKKPQKEFFEIMMNKIGLNKDEVQFWDDTGKNVEMAKEYGFDARQYSKFEEFEKEMFKLTK